MNATHGRMVKKRVIIDTNCWISFLIGKRLSMLVPLLTEEQVNIVLCEELIGEIEDVTSRPKFAKYFPADEVKSLLSFLRLRCTMVEPTCDVEMCRDAADDYLLSLAKTSKAHYLVTGDKDLLVIGKIGNCQIVDPTTFENIILAAS